MKTLIENSFLKAEINHKGAELSALIKDGKNYIWEVDVVFWDKTSPVLFPIVGGLKNDSFEYEDQNYKLPRHGFAREQDFELVEKTEESAKFRLKYSEESLKIYPFLFELTISYWLLDNKLMISYRVKNLSEKEMYYSIGAHPAFAVPGNFEDFTLKFDSDQTLISHQLSDNLFSGKTKEIELHDGVLPLTYELFANDAIVLKDSATRSLTLNHLGKDLLKVDFPKFPYLGIWTKKNAPFICIEPWLGIADNQSATGKIEEKEGIQQLNGNALQDFIWSIEVF